MLFYSYFYLSTNEFIMFVNGELSSDLYAKQIVMASS